MRKLLIIPILFFCAASTAQNLVPNPGFESVAPCPNDLSQLGSAFPWSRPTGSSTTPDVFNSCNTTIINPNCPVDVPLNFGGVVPALGGNGYAGIICYYESSLNLREYLSITLSAALIKGAGYRISFNVHKAPDCKYSVDKIGLALSGTPLFQNNANNINITPTVESTANNGPTWTAISRNYVAQGGERYLTIGNFRSDFGTVIVNHGSSSTGCLIADIGAYYFIDDVLVEQLPENLSLDGDTIICLGESTTLTANSNVNVWWALDSQPFDTIATGSTLTVSPQSTTSYIANGVLLKDTIKVRVVNPPLVFLGRDTAVCEGKRIVFDAMNTGSQFLWSTGNTTAVLSISTPGIYWVRVSNDGCSRSDTVEVDIKSNPSIDLGTDSVICAVYGDSIILDAGIAVSYAWFPDTIKTQFFSVTNPGIHAVVVTYANGCKNSSKINVIEYCPEVLFVPNSFTPNGDGKNEQWKAFGNNISQFEMQIFNRSGSVIFSSDNLNTWWDGTYKGEEAPGGVYIYSIFYSAFNAQGRINYYKKTGSIHLIR